jgi:hypothetical protein
MYFDKHDEYVEKLLQAQYDISDIIDHELTKGECREEFLRNQIEQQFKLINCVKGIICLGSEQLGQCDVCLVSQSVRTRTIGAQSLIDPRSAKLIFDVKSTIRHEDLVKANFLAEKLRDKIGNTFPLVGIFGYRIEIQKDNFIKKFGYSYDKESETYVPDTSCRISLPNIDFIVSLHDKAELDQSGYRDERSFFIRKDRSSNKYILFLGKPTIKPFFELVTSACII